MSDSPLFPSAQALSKIFLIQSLAGQIPEEKPFFEFVCSGLADLPGVDNVWHEGQSPTVSLDPPPDADADLHRFPLKLNGEIFAVFMLKVTDPESFLSCTPYIHNLCFALAVMLEERKLRKELLEHQQVIESRVEERTRDLQKEARERRSAENKALVQRNRAERYLEVADAITLEVDERGIIALVNQRGCQILGCSREELIGKDWFSVALPEEEGPRFREILQAALSRDDEQRDVFESELLDGDGKRRHIVWRVAPQGSADGRSILLSGLDITARKEAEETTRRSEKLFRTIFRSIGDAVITTDREGNVQFLNSVAEGMTGWKEEEAFGTPLPEIFKIISEDTRGHVENPYNKVLREKGVVGLANHTLLIARDGTELPIADSGAPIIDDRGEITGVVLVFQDQSEERNYLRQIEESRRHMFTLLSNLPGVAYRCGNTADWCMEFVSSGSLELTGFAPEELVNNAEVAFADLVHPEDRDAVWNEVQQALARKERFQLEYRLVPREGRPKRVWAQGCGIFSPEGDLLALEGFIADITERWEAEEALRQNETLLKRTESIAHIGSWEFDLTANHMTSSDEVYRIFGLRPQEFAASYGIFLEAVHPEDRRSVVSAYKRSLSEGKETYEMEHRIIRKDTGSVRFVYERCNHLRDENGTIVRSFGMIQDITERKRTEQELIKQKKLFETMFNTITDGVVITNTDREIVLANNGMKTTFGYHPQDLVGEKTAILYSDEDYYSSAGRHVFGQQSPSRNSTYTTMYQTIEGKVFPGETFGTKLFDEQNQWIGNLGIMRDITEQKSYEEQLEHQATHDELTGLANRTLMYDRLNQAIHYAERSGRFVFVLLLDMDRFKIVNDSLGHSAGDELLKDVSDRLRGLVRDSDTVARLGGDEFVLVLSGVANIDDVALLSKKILENLRRPYCVQGREVTLSASVGVSTYPRDGTDVEVLLSNADTAMYRAKEEGDTARFYAPQMNQSVKELLELEADLRRAIEREELLLHYQPKVDLVDGRIIGAEALLRWKHPQNGLISPGVFIPLAEETGLIHPIGDWVLATICEQLGDWQSRGLPLVPVAGNLSALQFRQPDLPEKVMALLRQSGIDPGLLELELTESMLMRDPAEAVKTMKKLKALGVALSLDDFGTGYSSLNYLRRFPVDYLKIDGSFIMDMGRDSSAESVVTSIVDIAHNLGLKAIGEMVETEEQIRLLSRCGCDYYQGFYYSRPVPAENFVGLLTQGPVFLDTGLG